MILSRILPFEEKVKMHFIEKWRDLSKASWNLKKGWFEDQTLFFCIIWVKLDALYLKILNVSNRLPFICKNKKKNEEKWDIVNLNCCQMPYFWVNFNSFTLENRLNWPIINVIKPVYAFEGHSINFQHKNSNLVPFSIIKV